MEGIKELQNQLIADIDPGIFGRGEGGIWKKNDTQKVNALCNVFQHILKRNLEKIGKKLLEGRRGASLPTPHKSIPG